MKKDVKKILSLGILALVMMSFFSGFVSASLKDNIKSFFDHPVSSIQTGIGTPLTNYLNNLDPTTNAPLVRFLFFILVFLVIFVILDYVGDFFKDKPVVKSIFAAVVGILSVYFIPKEFLTMILNPYSAMGIALLTIIPFVLLFVFTSKVIDNTFIRSLVWFIFAISMLVLMIISADKVTNTSASIAAWIYGIASVVGAVMCLFGDRVGEMMWKGQLEGTEDKANKAIEEDLTNEQLMRKKRKLEVDALVNKGAFPKV